jgi:iron(III) transport system permease protein
MAANQMFIGTRKSFTTVTGKSSNIALVKLRGLRTPLSAGIVVLLTAIAVLPLITFAIESFMCWRQVTIRLKNFTTIFWVGEGQCGRGRWRAGHSAQQLRLARLCGTACGCRWWWR